MFYLFWFKEDQQTFVAKEDDVVTPGDRIVGQIYKVKYGKRLWEGKLISKSKFKSGLTKLHVTKEGELIVPHLQPIKINKFTNNNKFTTELKTSNKSLKRRREQNQRAYEENYAQTYQDDESHTDIQSFEISKKKKENSDIIDKGVNETMANVTSDIVRDDELKDDTLKPDTEKENNSLAMFGIDEDLEITDNMIKLQEQYLNFLKYKKLLQDEKKMNGEDHLVKKLLVLPKWKVVNSSKKELVSGKGVWISISSLEEYEQVTQDDPSKLVRLILKDLIGTSVLKDSCALGLRNNRKGIDKDVRETLREFIQNKYFKGKKPWSQFNEVINQMCQNIRTEKKNAPTTNDQSLPTQDAQHQESSKISRREFEKKLTDTVQKSTLSLRQLGFSTQESQPKQQESPRSRKVPECVSEVVTTTVKQSISPPSTITSLVPSQPTQQESLSSKVPECESEVITTTVEQSISPPSTITSLIPSQPTQQESLSPKVPECESDVITTTVEQSISPPSTITSIIPSQPTQQESLSPKVPECESEVITTTVKKTISPPTNTISAISTQVSKLPQTETSQWSDKDRYLSNEYSMLNQPEPPVHQPIHYSDINSQYFSNRYQMHQQAEPSAHQPLQYSDMNSQYLFNQHTMNQQPGRPPLQSLHHYNVHPQYLSNHYPIHQQPGPLHHPNQYDPHHDPQYLSNHSSMHQLQPGPLAQQLLHYLDVNPEFSSNHHPLQKQTLQPQHQVQSQE